MKLAFVLIGVPIATYLVLALLPRGKVAFVGIVGAAITAALCYVQQLESGESFFVATILLVFSAISLATLVQLLRLVLGEGRPKWVYPLIVFLALLAIGIPMIKLLVV
jgi:hypothetical protein